MTAQKLTPWFPGNAKPVRDGVYERVGRSGCYFFSRFRRGKWFLGHIWINYAAYETTVGNDQNLPWRGLAHDPKGKK